MNSILSKNKNIKIVIPDLNENNEDYKKILSLLIKNGFKIYTKHLPIIFAEK